MQRFVIATIRQDWKPVFIEGQQYVLRLPDEDGNVQLETSEDEDPETGQTFERCSFCLRKLRQRHATGDRW